MDKPILILAISLVVFVSGCTIDQTEPSGSITGTVRGTNETVRVQAIQNLSLVAETTTAADGTYSLEVPEGVYGLLFIHNDSKLHSNRLFNRVYIYNDEINMNWFSQFSSGKQINETVMVEKGTNTTIDINLGKEIADYFSDHVRVIFKDNMSEEEINSILHSYNSNIISRQNYSIDTSLYFLSIPQDRTVLEMVLLFQSDPQVEGAFISTTLSIG